MEIHDYDYFKHSPEVQEYIQQEMEIIGLVHPHALYDYEIRVDEGVRLVIVVITPGEVMDDRLFNKSLVGSMARFHEAYGPALRQGGQTVKAGRFPG
jgi:hypothetical protein